MVKKKAVKKTAKKKVPIDPKDVKLYKVSYVNWSDVCQENYIEEMSDLINERHTWGDCDHSLVSADDMFAFLMNECKYTGDDDEGLDAVSHITYVCNRIREMQAKNKKEDIFIDLEN